MVHLAVLIGSAYTINSLSSYFEVVICPHWEVIEASTWSVMDALMTQLLQGSLLGHISSVFEASVYCAMGDTHLEPQAMKHYTSHNLLLEAAPTVSPDSSSREHICSSHKTVIQSLSLPTEKRINTHQHSCSCNLVPFLEPLQHWVLSPLGCPTQQWGSGLQGAAPMELEWHCWDHSHYRRRQWHRWQEPISTTSFALQALSSSQAFVAAPTGNIQAASHIRGREDPSTEECFFH